jgi:SAM-dependent methyltransferase
MSADPSADPSGGVSSSLIARAEPHAGPPEVRSASRLGFAGVWIRRLVQRFTRFQWQAQGEYNRAVLDALRAQDAALAALSGQIGELSRSLEAVISQSLPALGGQMGSLSRSLEAVVSDSVPRLGSQIGQVSRTVEAIVGESIPSLGEQLGKVSRTVEQMVGDSLPALGEQLGLVGKTVQELSEGFSEVYNTLHAQGRHLDALALQVGDFGETIETAHGETEAFEERVAAEAKRLDETMQDLLARWRPNLHFDHFDFSRKHRGSEEELLRRMAKYALLFGPVGRVLDAGCGRGEFLEACREAGVGAYGVETDPDMVSRCRMKALEVYEADALEHLRGLEDRSLDGLFMAQVVEHLTSAEIVELVRLAAAKLRRGAKIIVETINPDTFTALRWFWMDPTHRQPVSAATLRFLLEDAGFTMRDVLYSSPVPEDEALQRLPERAGAAAGADIETIRLFNRNVEKLNRVLFAEQDYAIFAER